MIFDVVIRLPTSQKNGELHGELLRAVWGARAGWVGVGQGAETNESGDFVGCGKRCGNQRFRGVPPQFSEPFEMDCEIVSGEMLAALWLIFHELVEQWGFCYGSWTSKHHWVGGPSWWTGDYLELATQNTHDKIGIVDSRKNKYVYHRYSMIFW